MTGLVVVATLVAGGLGALARYGVTRAFARRATHLPLAVLAVNVVGSLLGGAVLGWTGAGAIDAASHLILLSGFCGGLTTFSTLGVETVQLVLDGRTRVAAASIGANLVLGVAAAALGFMLTH